MATTDYTPFSSSTAYYYELIRQAYEGMKTKPTQDLRQTLADVLKRAISADGCPLKLSTKNLERMVRGTVGSKFAAAVCAYMVNPSRLERDLFKIFNVGDRPQPVYEFHDSTKRIPIFARFEKYYFAKYGYPPEVWPAGGVEQWVPSKYSLRRQTSKSSPRFLIHSIVAIRYAAMCGTPFHKLAKEYREDLLLRIYGDIEDNCFPVEGSDDGLVQESYKSHLEKVMEKHGIRRVRCIATGRLVQKEETVPVELYDINNEKLPKAGYVLASHVPTLVRIGVWDDEKRMVFVDKNHIRTLDRKELAHLQSIPGGVGPKLAIVSWKMGTYVITNLNDVRSVFVARKRTSMLLSATAQLLNYSTQTNGHFAFKRDHLHRCGFEVEVSSPYTVENAPLWEGRPVDPQTFFSRTGWAPTFDRSVEPGFELKSPIISFDTPADIRKCIPEEVRALIDRSTKGDNCGGHIHYSNRDQPPEYLFRYMQRWTWLFALIYPLRIGNHYCELRNDKPQSDKYQWLRLREGRIEVRIFPAFRRATALAWRASLLAKMVSVRPPTTGAAFDALGMDSEQLATHILAVRSAAELRQNFESQKVQAHLMNVLGHSAGDLKKIRASLEALEPIE